MRTSLLFSLLFTFGFAFSQTPKDVVDDGSKPFVLGVVEEFSSKILGETRTLNIYLPEGYRTNNYPVIYLLDGSADEDFIHVVGLVQFNNFSWIDRLPKSIVVGIGNVDRKRDFTAPTSIATDQKRFPSTGHSEKFIEFIEMELQPFIEKKYSKSNSRMLIGQSLGGLLATEILLKKPHLFNRYVIISPSLWWDDGAFLKLDGPVLHAGYKEPTSVYIAVGKEGLVDCEIPHVMEVDANLLADKLMQSKSEQFRSFLDYLPGEDHGTISHIAIFNAFRWLYPAKTAAK